MVAIWSQLEKPQRNSRLVTQAVPVPVTERRGVVGSLDSRLQMNDPVLWGRVVDVVTDVLKVSSPDVTTQTFMEAVSCAQACKIKAVLTKTQSSDSKCTLLSQLDSLALSHRAVQTSGIAQSVRSLMTYPDARLQALASTMISTWEQLKPAAGADVLIDFLIDRSGAFTRTVSEERVRASVGKRMREQGEGPAAQEAK